MSSRRHEQAEREAVKQVATDYAQLWGLILLAAVIFFIIGGPWVEWDQHGHQLGWAVLGVFDDLLGAAILALIIAVKTGNMRSSKSNPPRAPAAAMGNRAAPAFEERARRVAASTIELRDIDNSLLRARVKNIREGRSGL